jgi:hypothetical protein
VDDSKSDEKPDGRVVTSEIILTGCREVRAVTADGQFDFVMIVTELTEPSGVMNGQVMMK